MFNNILVVCVGNICRSPTAERLLQRYHPELKVSPLDSALVGKGADPTISASPAEHQLSLEGHWYDKSAAACVATIDLILTMEKAPYRTLCEMAHKCAAK